MADRRESCDPLASERSVPESGAGDPMPEPKAPARERLFDGPGELRQLCRAFNWASTPLGPSTQWPPALRVTVQVVLSSGLPAIVLWGRELIQIYNDAYARLIQDKHPAALGRSNLEIWPEVAHINRPIFDRVFVGETVTIEDARFPLRRSGEIEDVYLTISYGPIREDHGEVRGVLASMYETTKDVELRALEAERERLLRELGAERERLTMVFQMAPAFIATMRGPTHVFEMANPAFDQLAGHRDLLGRTVREAFPDIEGQGFYELLDRVYTTGEPFVGNEMPLLLQPHPDAVPEQRFINFVYLPMRGVDGSVEGVLVHGVDVTDLVLARKRVDAQARELQSEAASAEDARRGAEEARREADRANRAKSDFLATMSHELRTPLNAIVGYADLLLAGIPQQLHPESKRSVERIAVSSRHLRELIEEVLLFSRLEAERERVEPVPIDLAELLEEVHALCEPLALEKGLDFRYRVHSVPDEFVTDARKLRQILLNLLANAIQFTDGGEVALELEVVGDDELEFRVADTGRGIAPEHMERIFEPFWQAPSAAAGSSAGTGLGLSVTRSLAELLGGSVEVESRPGDGSTFTVRLPVRWRPVPAVSS